MPDEDISTPPSAPSLREQQAELTKQIVLEATRRLILESDPEQFTMQRVAREAGVAYRTVYRYFPNRQALLDEFSEWIEREFTDFPPPMDPGFEPIDKAVRQLFSRFDYYAEYYEAVALLGGGILRPANQGERTREMREVFDEEFPDLNPDEANRAFAVLRLLFSSQTWFSLRERFGLKDGESGEAVGWAVRVLVEAIRANDLPVRRQ